MTLPMTFLLALSLSMDAFAASLAKGAAFRPSVPQALGVGVAFGLFELATPVFGWLVGLTFSGWIEAVDHWVAFGLLVLVGAGMVRESLAGKEHCKGGCCDGNGCDGGGASARRRLGWAALATAAVATSVDATAVGITLAFTDVEILGTAAMIGAVTFAMALGGVCLGRVAGPLIGRRAELVGGLGLIAVGIKILAEHVLA